MRQQLGYGNNDGKGGLVTGQVERCRPDTRRGIRRRGSFRIGKQIYPSISSVDLLKQIMNHHFRSKLLN